MELLGYLLCPLLKSELHVADHRQEINKTWASDQMENHHLVSGQLPKTCDLDAFYTWSCDMVMLYWSAGVYLNVNLFLEYRGPIACHCRYRMDGTEKILSTTSLDTIGNQETLGVECTCLWAMLLAMMAIKNQMHRSPFSVHACIVMGLLLWGTLRCWGALL